MRTKQFLQTRPSGKHTTIRAALLALALGGFAAGAPAQQNPLPPPANSCGYEVTSGTYATWPGGYQAWVELSNVSGPTATDFSVLVDVGNTDITDGSIANYEQVEDGYSVTAPAWLRWQKIPPGASYRFHFNGAPDYEGVTPYVISVNGANCDSQPPSIRLSADRRFFSGEGTLTLTADVTDNVAVRKVVFERDGETLGEDRNAPFEYEIDVNESLNGFQLYTATAYDPSGNEAASTPARVSVAIGNKFFGTAPGGPEDYEHLLSFFNQVTPENAGKWGSVEGTRDVMDWAALDTAYYFAQSYGLPFKFHTLIWGQQQPAWIDTLAPEEQLAEIDEWMTLVAERYPDLEMIEVVNEPLHAPPAYLDALGGTGETGFDWVITAFEMAREHFPTAQLILNDYQILHLPEFTADYLAVIDLLKVRGLIDAIGVQAHFLERTQGSMVEANLETLAGAALPIYVSEFDLNFADDARQANVMRELFPVFWEQPAVAGVTHWGHLEGSVWRTNAYLLRADGTHRPALDWLVCYLGGDTNCPVPEYIPAGWQGDEYGVTLEAELYDDGEGLVALGGVVAYTDDGDWISFADVEFQQGWDTLWVTYAKGNVEVGSISIHLDSLANAPVTTVPLEPTGGWGSSETLEIPWNSLSGTRDVYVRFNDVPGIANLDSVRFGKPRPTSGENLVIDGGFEGAGIEGWQSWNGSTLALATGQVYGGNQSLLATNRPNNAQFAVYNLTDVVSAGTTYAVSAQVLQEGAATDTVRLAAKVGCSSGDSYPWLDNNTGVSPGVWTGLSGELVIPAECEIADVVIFFEGTTAGVDVYLDEVKVAPPAP